MLHHAHPTCTDWSSTRLYTPAAGIGIGGDVSSLPSTPSSTSSLNPPTLFPPPSSSSTSSTTSSPPPHPTTTTPTIPTLFTHPPCPLSPTSAPHTDALLISTHGAHHRPHPGHAPRCAAGVHFGAGSPLNAVYELCTADDEAAMATRQRVELWAGIKALERVGEVVRALEEERGRTSASAEEGEDEEGKEGVLSQVVVQTDSQYLVRCAVEWLPVWKGKGWMNSRGRVVANVDLFWYLDRRITWLEWVGVEVLFALVGREGNADAVRLVQGEKGGLD